MTPEQREQSVAKNAGARARKNGPKMRQAQLSLAIISKGRFDKSEPTIHKGKISTSRPTSAAAWH